MRTLVLVFAVLLGAWLPARAQVSVSIGINVPVFPELVPVPGYPVYYDPRGEANYFFYDGAYWVFRDDNWYTSTWYNGPWELTGPEYVPAFVLRVPVRYYRRPPPYFRGWVVDAPPRWGEHWGRAWEERRRGWDHWDRHARFHRAPLPVYQRQYAGREYPREIERQRLLRSQNYRYRPREAVVRRQFQAPRHEQRVERHERQVERHENRVEHHEQRVDREERRLQNSQRNWERAHERQREQAEREHARQQNRQQNREQNREHRREHH
ncbi:MAG TPA: hypothetical protein VFB36_00425 [Nevskiaceae bacterium]|nr:hypothetical protein [Nevskiaceae bacterium]